MQNFSGFLSMFFDNKYFSIIIVVLIMILFLILSYLLKSQKNTIKDLESQKGIEKPNKLDNQVTENTSPLNAEVLKESLPKTNNVLNIDSLENTQANIILDLKSSESDKASYINPIEAYENDEEENAVISTKELEAIEKERDEIYGKENNIKLIEEYEESQEKKAIISYNELLKNARSLELNYIEKPREEESAPLVKQVEIKEQSLKGVTYTAEEEYLKLLKEFRSKLIIDG